MRKTLLVVDDFYADPDQVLAEALTLDYKMYPNVRYPGLSADSRQDVSDLVRRIAGLLGVPLRWRWAQGAFRVTLKEHEQTRAQLIHLDGSDWTAVLHLSKDTTEGTYFYRHKALGLEYVPVDRDDVAAAVRRDTFDLDAWELIQYVPAKFNRLLIFEGRVFHSGAHSFHGSALCEGRITQNFFFDDARKPLDAAKGV